jgi:hypothetical protein
VIGAISRGSTNVISTTTLIEISPAMARAEKIELLTVRR